MDVIKKHYIVCNYCNNLKMDRSLAVCVIHVIFISRSRSPVIINTYIIINTLIVRQLELKKIQLLKSVLL